MLDPRRHRIRKQCIIIGSRTGNQCWKVTCRVRNQYSISLWNRDQNCPSPSVFRWKETILCNRSENTPPENPQTMSRSEWKPREPPTFSGRLKEDVHQWTAIVTQYFTLVPGTDQQQLTYAVSLLRGCAIEWYNAEVKKDNPIDWKSLVQKL